MVLSKLKGFHLDVLHRSLNVLSIGYESGAQSDCDDSAVSDGAQLTCLKRGCVNSAAF